MRDLIVRLIRSFARERRFTSKGNYDLVMPFQLRPAELKELRACRHARKFVRNPSSAFSRVAVVDRYRGNDSTRCRPTSQFTLFVRDAKWGVRAARQSRCAIYRRVRKPRSERRRFIIKVTPATGVNCTYHEREPVRETCASERVVTTDREEETG